MKEEEHQGTRSLILKENAKGESCWEKGVVLFAATWNSD